MHNKKKLKKPNLKGNQNPQIEERQKTQRKKNKRKNNDKQNIHKIKDLVTLTPLKIGGELRCFGRVRSSCSTSGTRGITKY
jgi:hypothetical protein